MNKKGSWVFWVSFGVVLLVVFGLFLIYISFNPRNERLYTSDSSPRIVNPVTEKSIDEAISDFNEKYIYYMLFSIKAYNLHNPPLSSETPKIEIIVDDESFNSEITKGVINVYRGEIEDEDIRIYTTKREIVLALKDENYIKESFINGDSKFEQVEGQATLFSKGYLNLYKQLTGKGITGNVVRIYLS